MKRQNQKYNILLVKDDVGRPKPNTRNLPGDNFVFGKKEIRDVEDAGMGKSEEYWNMARYKKDLRNQMFQAEVSNLISLSLNVVASKWDYHKMSNLKR